MELETMLAKLQDELKTSFDKARDEQKALGAVQAETKTAIENLQRQVDAMDVQMQKAATGKPQRSFQDDLKENESFQKLSRDGSGTAILHFKGGLPELEKKTLIDTTAVGNGTSGVLMPGRMPGVDMGPRQELFIRDLLRSVPTSDNAVDYVKVNVFTNAASPQTEGSAKAESALTFTTGTASVKTIAHWIPATKQILADFAGLQAIISDELVYGLKLKEEAEILSGDNTGEHLNGLITQATAFSTALLTASNGWEKVDILARSMQQIGTANQYPVEWWALSYADWFDIMLQKNSLGDYIAGNAYNLLAPSVWGRRVLVSNSMTAGTFLAGNTRGAQIRDREGVTVEISTEHSTYFTENKVAIRCEERLALVVPRPASFIYGSLNTSPA